MLDVFLEVERRINLRVETDEAKDNDQPDDQATGHAIEKPQQDNYG